LRWWHEPCCQTGVHAIKPLPLSEHGRRCPFAPPPPGAGWSKLWSSTAMPTHRAGSRTGRPGGRWASFTCSGFAGFCCACKPCFLLPASAVSLGPCFCSRCACRPCCLLCCHAGSGQHACSALSLLLPASSLPSCLRSPYPAACVLLTCLPADEFGRAVRRRSRQRVHDPVVVSPA